MKNITHLKAACFIVTLSTVALLSTSSCNSGNTSATSATSSDTIKGGKDTQFLAKVAEINLEEIRLGQLAQQKSTVTSVKDLGSMMENEHNKAQIDLTTLAMKKSITIPTALDSNAQADYND